MNVKTIGVLAVQGAFREHLHMLEQIEGIKAVPVKSCPDLALIDGLILPGGESTTQGKLLRDFGLQNPLKQAIQQGMPVWGTCAGMILMARNIAGGEPPHLGVMDITVRRNAYGGQLDSFTDSAVIAAVSSSPLPCVFIRAPWIEEMGKDVRSLAELDGRIIAARQGNRIVTSFHPELTGDLRFHRFFASLL